MDPHYGNPQFHHHHHHHHGHGYGGRHGSYDMFEWLPLLGGMLLLFALARLLLTSGVDPRLLVSWLRPRPDPVRTRWQAAVAKHQATAREFAAYECNPVDVLRRPELADVTRPATGRFVDAFAEAAALATDEYPGAAHAELFIQAAERAARAWQAAVDAADRGGAVRFPPRERALLDQILALLAVAGDSEYEAERHSAYQRARRRIMELERRTGWALPRQATAVLERRARGMLPPANPAPAG
jgi:hypothetical protein